MRSSTGAHFIALDHVRAFAAFMVFAWHFTHGGQGSPIPFTYVPMVFPLSLLDNGHTGVALFMTLSGYLFAKLLDGKSIHYPSFLWNRVLRLLPLLLFVVMLVALKTFLTGHDVLRYAWTVATGIALPTIPNGGWSITVEFHYYLILPLFLWMVRRSKWLPVTIILAAIALRVVLYHARGEIQSLAYWTIVGRIDQFALGMLFFQFRTHFIRRHTLAIGALCGLALVYAYFDRAGVLSQDVSDPSSSPLWIILPTLEGLAYAIGIAWYDSSFSPSTTGVSKWIGRIGEYSYSIYLFHFFFVFREARFVNERIMPITNFYVACLWSLVFFLLMLPVGYLSFRFIEGPFLRLRKRYIVGAAAPRPTESRELEGGQP
jgi:peptidoglycan/LPS O-acetylase OafA/YrhL